MTRIALLQMDLVFGRPEDNKQKAGKMIEEATAQKAEIVVLPELWTTGYALTKISELADPNGQAFQAFFSEQAKKYGITIVGGSIAERSTDDAVFNTSYTFSHTGERLNAYRKIHLFQLMDEHLYLHAGDQVTTYDIHNVPASTIICYDLRFPELTRTLALSGVQMIFIPAEWPHPRLQHWRQLQIARAIENQLFMISCNRVGKAGDTEFFGHSMVVDPWGEVLLECSEEEGVFVVDIDLSLVAEVRKKIPVFADRRPHLYTSAHF
ncbi:carbon-nitrogen family hydrolase [Fodinisporobacter ferrooxydans]|uniref:Carbon-nitrogen family hydrolase n=1 Tax=Fodinisporobacter ferrooxydans TaxID=2901836 RepID=A0ABY4CIA0_9BACL|nr:carbon-nitrogen family hydrolase [Alicyclobacillaceae bacterium MYW30-H2]